MAKVGSLRDEDPMRGLDGVAQVWGRKPGADSASGKKRKKSYYILGIGDSGHVRRHMGSFDWREGINE